MSEIISKIKRIIDVEKTKQGCYNIKFRGNDNIIFVGLLHDAPETLELEELIFKGEWEELTANQEKQFKFHTYILRDAMKYFFNKVIKISNKALNDILRVHSIKSLETILEEDPEQLLEFKGIGKKTIEKIEKKWEAHKFDTEVFHKLMPYNFSTTIIENIIEEIGSSQRILDILEKDPYQLTHVEGVNFNKIDVVVLKSKKIPLSFKNRINEGIRYAAKRYMDNTGNTLIPYDKLFEDSKTILNGEDENGFYRLHELDFIAAIDNIDNDNFIEIKDELSLRDIYKKEIYIYETLVENGLKKGTRLVEDVDLWINNKEKDGNFKLSDQQKNIIRIANEQYSIFSLSGYAGTGKTMVSRLVMELYNESNKKIHCCALSGVAANRIKLVSGFNSKTIHALLGSDGINFNFNPNNTLPYDLIVIDETGMVNTDMFYYLLQAINWNRTKLFIIGDPAQLLPVGLGNVYQDLLDLNLVNNTTLNQVFRQKDGSIINIVAQHIRKNEFPKEYHNYSNYGFFTHFLPWDSNMDIRIQNTVEKLVEIVKNNKVKSYTEDNLLDLQIITPTKSSDVGTYKLNQIAQEIFNPKGKFVYAKGFKFKKNDKVIHLKNIVMDIDNHIEYKEDKDKIYNGQIGIVTKVTDNTVSVKYPYEKQEVTYKLDLLQEGYLSLAYVLTAHKCQGNEFKDVVMTSSFSDIHMLNANYLYSAMTRAKENLYIVGDLFALTKGLSLENQKVRETILKNIK